MPHAQAAVDRGLLRSGKRTQYDPADMGKVLDVAAQVAAGLQHLHARGIVHGGALPIGPCRQFAFDYAQTRSSVVHGQYLHGSIASLNRTAVIRHEVVHIRCGGRHRQQHLHRKTRAAQILDRHLSASSISVCACLTRAPVAPQT